MTSAMGHVVKFGLLAVLFPVLFGQAQFMVVLSASMEPVLMTGDLALVAPLPPEEVEVGDVLTFKDPGGRTDILISHRVVERLEGPEGLAFRTRGDNLEEEDPHPVPAENVWGRVVFVIPGVGKFVNGLHAYRAPLVLALVVVPVLGLLAGQAHALWRRRAGRGAPSPRRAAPPAFERRAVPARLLVTLAAALVTFGWVATPFLLMSGDAPEGALRNGAPVDGVFILTGGEHELPGYHVLAPGAAVETAAAAEVAAAPAFLPLFWVLALAALGPYVPALATAALPALAVTLALRPLWSRRVRVRTTFELVRTAPG